MKRSQNTVIGWLARFVLGSLAVLASGGAPALELVQCVI
jgi:hypothetical protein